MIHNFTSSLTTQDDEDDEDDEDGEDGEDDKDKNCYYGDENYVN